MAVRGSRSGPLFPAVRRGGGLGIKPITDQAVYDIVRRLGRRAGIENLNSRCLRRTCVVALIAAGRPLPEVQAHLGHGSWVTTAAYTELAAETGTAIDPTELPYRPPPGRRARTPRGLAPEREDA